MDTKVFIAISSFVAAAVVTFLGFLLLLGLAGCGGPDGTTHGLQKPRNFSCNQFNCPFGPYQGTDCSECSPAQFTACYSDFQNLCGSGDTTTPGGLPADAGDVGPHCPPATIVCSDIFPCRGSIQWDAAGICRFTQIPDYCQIVESTCPGGHFYDGGTPDSDKGRGKKHKHNPHDDFDSSLGN